MVKILALRISQKSGIRFALLNNYSCNPFLRIACVQYTTLVRSFVRFWHTGLSFMLFMYLFMRPE